MRAEGVGGGALEAGEVDGRALELAALDACLVGAGAAQVLKVGRGVGGALAGCGVGVFSKLDARGHFASARTVAVVYSGGRRTPGHVARGGADEADAKGEGCSKEEGSDAGDRCRDI